MHLVGPPAPPPPLPLPPVPPWLTVNQKRAIMGLAPIKDPAPFKDPADIARDTKPPEPIKPRIKNRIKPRHYYEKDLGSGYEK